jgi:hypothetical protein
MEDSQTKLTQIQFTILDGLADDYENVEQLYLYANGEYVAGAQAEGHCPRVVIEVRFPLRDLLDGIGEMLRAGYIAVQYSDDERVARVRPVDFSALHYYWFGVTEAGKREWIAYRTLMGSPQ